MNGHSVETYPNIMRAIYSLLREGGKWFTTTLHIDTGCIHNKNYMYNHIQAYSLLFGNEGSYPNSPDGLTKHARNTGFKIVLQENRWLDYFLYSTLWVACYRNSLLSMNSFDRLKWNLRNFNLFIASPNFIESYMCYTPNMPFAYQPWMWQFIVQWYGKDRYCVPTTHQWIIFQT